MVVHRSVIPVLQKEEKRRRLGNSLKLVGRLAWHLQQRTRDLCKTVDPSCLQSGKQVVKFKLWIASPPAKTTSSQPSAVSSAPLISQKSLFRSDVLIILPVNSTCTSRGVERTQAPIPGRLSSNKSS